MAKLERPVKRPRFTTHEKAPSSRTAKMPVKTNPDSSIMSLTEGERDETVSIYYKDINWADYCISTPELDSNYFGKITKKRR